MKKRVFDSGKLQTVTELQKSYYEWDLNIISPFPLQCFSAFNYHSIASYIKIKEMNRKDIDSFHLINRGEKNNI